MRVMTREVLGEQVNPCPKTIGLNTKIANVSLEA